MHAMLRAIVSKLSRVQGRNPGPLEVAVFKALSRRRKIDLIAVDCSAPKRRRIRYRHVVIGMFRAEISSNFLDLYLYQALKDAGVDVKVVLCDGSTFPCDSIGSKSNVLSYRCMHCKATQQQFGEILVDEDIIRPVRTEAALSPANSVNAIFSAQRFDQLESGYDEKLAAKYQQTYDAVRRLLQQTKDVDLVIMSHGMYATWGAMRDFCVERGIDYITWGRTYFSNMISVVKNSTINEGVNSLYAGVETVHPEELKELLGCIDTRLSNQESVDYYAYLDHSSQASSTILDRVTAHDGKVVGIYLGIPWDGTVYGSLGDFNSQQDLIQSVLDGAAENPEILYVFRVHPRESETKEKASVQIRQLCNGRLPNVIVLDAQSTVTSYELMKVVDLNIVYSGTLALEIARAGLPLIVCGRNPASNFDGIKTIDTARGLQAIWCSDYSCYIPRNVETLFNNIAKTFYIDDLSETTGYDVTSFNEGSKLVCRIVSELICED